MRGRAKPLDQEGLYAYAGRLLGGRALSLGELREKLNRRAADRSSVSAVLARLKAAGWADDRKFAESFAGARRDGAGLGKSRVLRDLMARRVAPGLAREAAEKAFTGVDEAAMIERFLERKFRHRDLSVEKNLASAYRRLRAAGFSAGTSIRVLKRFSERAEELAEE